MVITQFSDYSLRVLLYLGLKKEKATVGEISESFGISRNHLVKVVHHLSQSSYIRSYRGKGGGIELNVPPEQIKIGEFLRRQEPLDLVECFNPQSNTCPIIGVCQLETALYEARESFIQSLNNYTLADFLKPGHITTQRLMKLRIA